MPRSPYDWEPGKEFPVIQQHSVAKHDILRAYLCAYIRTLVSNPNREEFRLLLVDGFAGGGVYRDAGTKEEVLGSPFIMLEAAREAEAIINVDRRKPVRLNIDYYFIEIKHAAAACLRSALMERGHGARLDRDIFVFQTSFEKKVDELIERARQKMPRSTRAIFLLDQYGYSQAPTELIAKILRSLSGGEIILTFAVDALINYYSEHSKITKSLLAKAGIPDALRGRSFDDIKKSEKDWRLFIQACLYRELVEQCKAKYYTLFFIRSSGGHGDYWLICRASRQLGQNA
jgi:three-Cys-motif partner protein